MFVLSQSETYLWPVTVAIPSAKNPGKADSHTFKVEFKRLTQTEIKKLLKGDEDGADIEILKEFVVGWKEVMQSPTEEMPFTEAALALLLEKNPGIGMIILRAFFESIAPGSGAKAKN